MVCYSFGRKRVWHGRITDIDEETDSVWLRFDSRRDGITMLEVKPTVFRIEDLPLLEVGVRVIFRTTPMPGRPKVSFRILRTVLTPEQAAAEEKRILELVAALTELFADMENPFDPEVVQKAVAKRNS